MLLSEETTNALAMQDQYDLKGALRLDIVTYELDLVANARLG